MMATGNEGSSDGAKDAHREAFHDAGRSAFVADLTRRVVHKHELATRHERVLRLLGRARARRH